MAEVQQNSGGNGKKGAQKKMQIRVDFTPMVDMNMLLITFFMLCTTMIKSQTLTIALPSNEKVENQENMSQASADDAVTIIIDAKRKKGSNEVDSVNGQVVNEVYYYFGKPGGDAGMFGAGGTVLSENNNIQKSEFLTDEVMVESTPLVAFARLSSSVTTTCSLRSTILRRSMPTEVLAALRLRLTARKPRRPMMRLLLK